jgi:hypothetical protein
VIESIQKQQKNNLENVLSNAARLEKLAKELQEKIKSNGISGYYSINHDVAEVCFKIHRQCGHLSRLKQIEMQFRDIEKKSKKKKKKK